MQCISVPLESSILPSIDSLLYHQVEHMYLVGLLVVAGEDQSLIDIKSIPINSGIKDVTLRKPSPQIPKNDPLVPPAGQNQVLILLEFD